MQAHWQDTAGVLHQALSAQRSEQFGQDYGIWLKSGVCYSGLSLCLIATTTSSTPSTSHDQLREPDYAAAMQAVQQSSSGNDDSVMGS